MDGASGKIETYPSALFNFFLIACKFYEISHKWPFSNVVQ